MTFQALLQRIFRNYLLFTFAMVVLAALLYPFIPFVKFKIIALNLAYMFVITGLSGGFMAVTFNKQHTYFMMALGGSMFLKMFLSLGYLYGMITANRSEVLIIIFSFFFFYFLFTGFEVYQIMHKLRPHLKRNETSENS